MRKREPMQIKTWVYWHNLGLSIGSALLLLTMLAEVVRLNVVEEHPLYDIYCPGPADRTDGYLYAIYYVNYLFKYVELLDTVQLALKKKPLTLLQCVLSIQFVIFFKILLIVIWL